MRYLLDTHIIIWTLENNKNLPKKVVDIVRDEENDIYYSAASIWETTIKKMARPQFINMTGSKMSDLCIASGFVPLPIYDRHIKCLETLKDNKKATNHKDPFDRMLLSQAKSDGMILVTHDAVLGGYDEDCILKV